MEDRKRKAIPFRYYQADIEEDMEQLYLVQGYTKKFNVALTHAVKIAAAYIRKMEKEKPKKKKGATYQLGRQPKTLVEGSLGIRLGW